MSTPILVSACLLGVPCRYDGATKTYPHLMGYFAARKLTPIPICPEQAGGLPTPRPPCHFENGAGQEVLAGSAKVINSHGENKTAAFLQGARKALDTASEKNCRTALMKERSPSCGVQRVYNEKGIMIGEGVTTALLKQHDIAVFSEEELSSLGELFPNTGGL